MTLTIDNLNESQRQAAEWDEGPLLVLAGPGSGKTAVLTLRIANIIKSTPNESFRILGLTFTVKAANEMQERVRALLENGVSKRVQIRTFHSFCADILRQHGSHLGLRPDFEVITNDNDRVAILKEMQFNGVEYIDAPEDSLKLIDSFFTHGINLMELRARFSNGQEQNHEMTKNFFSHYLESLIKNNRLDFGSMLYFTRKLFEEKPRIARQVNTVYKYVCVDEFQDTNAAQYKILRLLCDSPNANLFVVADDDQIIFQWNGADPKRLEELKKDYSPKEVQLPENFRCPPEVVSLANNLIAHNPNRSLNKKAGVSHNTAKQGTVRLMPAFNTFDDEVAGLVSELNKILKNQRSNCLVLARSNKLLESAKNELKARDINAEIISKQQDFASSLVLFVYYILKLVNTPDSRSILNKLCAVASHIDGNSISAEEVTADAKVKSVTPLRAFFEKIPSNGKFDGIPDEGIKFLCDSLNYTQFVKKAFKAFDALNTTSAGSELFPDYESDKKNWDRISEKIRRDHSENVSLHVFLQEMDMTPKSKEPSADCVRLQTVHTAKGVEFKNVYIIGLVEEQFPTYFAINSNAKNRDAAMQEERRNCFVAITRTEENLYLSYAKNYFGHPKCPSRFLREMGLNCGETRTESGFTNPKVHLDKTQCAAVQSAKHAPRANL
jgi:DNA helicase-2/ATP-dependent DNA helicase PcrA